jgi:hypothetical protein
MYPGGKNVTFHKIINLIPPHGTYIELFLGSGAVMRAKRPAALNIGVELNPNVLTETAASIAPGSIVVYGDAYRSPSLNQAMGSGIEAHAKNGDVSPGNIPANGDGGAASPKMASWTTIEGNGDASGAIARNSDADITGDVRIVNNSDGISWQFLCMDALHFLERYPFTGREFVYADPPYLMETRRSQRQLYLYELGEQEQHIALLTQLKRLPCPVAISGYGSDLYNDLLAGWHTYTFRARTRGGPVATEWLWMNYPQPTALHDYSFLGDTFRQRERIKGKKQRWVNRLRRMDVLERQALLWAIQEAERLDPIAESDDAPADFSEASP